MVTTFLVLGMDQNNLKNFFFVFFFDKFENIKKKNFRKNLGL